MLREDDRLFVKSEALGLSVVVPSATAALPVPTETRASFEADGASLPPELANSLKRVDEARRASMDGPMARWNLSQVRKSYQTLLVGASGPGAQRVIEERIALVDRISEMSRSADAFESLLQQSRNRDGQVAAIRAQIAGLREIESRAFDAEGLLQGTARRVDGEKVLSLLDDSGQIVTYLKLPVGVDTSRLLARRVGVRGRSRFNDELRYRLLDAREIVPLDSDR